MALTAREIIARLGLVPLEVEGGFFRETYRAGENIPPEALPARYREGARAFSTAIYYLLTPETVSRLHRVASDEVFHFYLGDPVTMLQLLPEGGSRVLTLGSRLEAGHHPQLVVPRGIWQGCLLAEGGAYALLGTTVAPGFEYRDFEAGRQEQLLAGWPGQRELILRLAPADD